MTDLERFAAALLSQWRSEGSVGAGPIGVGAILDRVLPYRVARRSLGIDVSEDYEAMVLRLVAEEAGLVRVDPLEAGEMARTTLAAKLPDLDVLKLLRSASVTLTDEAIERLDGVLPMPTSHDESKWAAQVERGDDDLPPDNSDIIPLPISPELAVAVAEAAAMPSASRSDMESPEPVSPSAEAWCWSCAEALPGNRQVKFCPFCGADQRQPACLACGTPVERRWRHCPECGARLGPGPA